MTPPYLCSGKIAKPHSDLGIHNKRTAKAQQGRELHPRGRI